MAISTGSNRGSNYTSDREPYYKRLDPIDGGYELTQADGRPLGQIRVFDDRAEGGAIHVQFGVGRGKFTKMAVMHCDSEQEYEDIIEALTLAQKQF